MIKSLIEDIHLHTMGPFSFKKTEIIHSELQRRILSGDLKIGDRLPTESELAREFDCSIGTVSKAVALLVHDGLVERRPRTGTRVIGATLHPFEPAASLDAFAFIYPSNQHESSWRMMKGFQKASKALHRRVVTLDTGIDYQRESEYISRLLEFDVCGAVISPVLVRSEDYAHFCGILLKCSVPIVVVGTQLHGMNCPAVFFDAFHAGYSLTIHLLDRGAKRIGFLCNQPSVTRSYFDGYLWALEERGVSPNEEWVFREESIHPNYEDPLEEPTRIGARFLETRRDKVDAVFCSQDYLALGLMKAASELGIRVPKDLKIVGVDGLELSAMAEIPLTSYNFPFEEAGAASFHMLNTLVSGQPANPSELKLRGKVRLGAST